MMAVLAQLEPVESVIVEAPTAGVGAVGLELLNSSAHLFLVAFLVTLLATPLIRRVAVAAGVVDVPDDGRKAHPYPVAYLGGVSVFAGLLAAILLSYVFVPQGLPSQHFRIPFAVVIGMVAVMFTGLADDVWGWDPRLKIAGQLVAAAALAINDVGVHVAAGVLHPLFGNSDTVLFSVTGFHVMSAHIYYWIGTALIAVFVLGGCNSANLIDGLDGLLSGIVGIVAVGLLVICLLVVPSYERDLAQVEEAVDAVKSEALRYRDKEDRMPGSIAEMVEAGYLEKPPPLPAGWVFEDTQFGGPVAINESRRTARALRDKAQERVRQLRDTSLPLTVGELTDLSTMPEGFSMRYNPNSGRVWVQEPSSPMSGSRMILCLALLGAVLGFLPHNFRPASIFLGDCGSLLLGYMCVVIILMLGDRGQTYFVFAGMIVFAVPIIDTTLAIIRRILARTPLSAGDHHHLHHQLKRSLGGVSRAVLALYGISALFAVVGIMLVVLQLHGLRVRVIYATALLLFSFIGMVAVKEAQRQKVQAAALGAASTRGEAPAAREDDTP